MMLKPTQATRAFILLRSPSKKYLRIAFTLALSVDVVTAKITFKPFASRLLSILIAISLFPPKNIDPYIIIPTHGAPDL